MSRANFFPLLLLSLWFCGCQKPQPEMQVEQRSLFRDSLYGFEQEDHTFRRDFLISGVKSRPVFIQRKPGILSFYLQVPPEARLLYSSHFAGKQAPEADPQIIVETDFPRTVRKNHLVRIGVSDQVDLSQFDEQIVRISFRSDGSRHGNLYWIDPVIEWVNENQSEIPSQLTAFRKRHEKNNVLIVVFDAGSAFHVSCYGYHRTTTPVMDALASSGVLWETAITQASYTGPSISTLLTGLYPEVHRQGLDYPVLPDHFKTMAEVFREAGYQTALFTGNPMVSQMGGLGQGFARVWKSQRLTVSRADDLVPEIQSWLDEVKDRRFFGYIHFREPHRPYRPPEKFLTLFQKSAESRELEDESKERPGVKERLIAAFDANLAFADEQLGKVLSHLQALGLMDRTILILLADHGEAFWEHGRQGHMEQVYEESIRIPFIIRFPGENFLGGIRRKELVGILDLMPTFMDLFQFSTKGVLFNGQSVLPSLFSKQQQQRLLISYCKGPHAAYSLRSQRFKYIHFVSERIPDEFFDLAANPREKRNDSIKYPILSAFYRMELQKQLEDLRRLSKRLPQEIPPEPLIDEHTREELHALGYIDK